MQGSRVCLLLTAALFDSGWILAAPPPGLVASFRFGPATGRPGEEVRVPVVVSSSEPLGGLSISVDFDEEVLEATGIDLVFQRSDGKGWYAKYLFLDVHVNGRSNINNDNATPGNGGVDEGFLYAAAVFEPEEGLAAYLADGGTLQALLPPANVENEILAIRFKIKPDAPLGSTEIRFLDGAPSVNPEVPVQNVAALLPGYSAELQTQVGVLGVGGLLAIVGTTPRGFIRGDTNGSKLVDMSDAVATLTALFSAARPIPCLDAADANDDGQVDISDPIAVLSFLFVSGKPLPPPTGAPGEDPTADSLDCASAAG